MQVENKEETLISHIEALRKVLIKSFRVFAIVLLFTLFIAPKALNYFIKFLIGKNEITLNYFSLTEVFILQIKIAIVISLVISFPYIAKNIWEFLVPALYENEKKFIKSIVLVSGFLFALGVLFCAFVILPLVVNFGLSFANSAINPLFGVSNIVNLSLWLMVVFGLMFQVPIVVCSLINWDIVSKETVASKRPYVIVGLLLLAAVLTPPDIVSQIVLFIPTYLLFECGLLFSKKKNAKN